MTITANTMTINDRNTNPSIQRPTLWNHWLALPLMACALLLGLPAMAQAGSETRAQGLHLLQPTLDAHGGLERWKSYRSFEYRLDGFPLTPQVAETSHSSVDLWNRFNRIQSKGYTVGWNGQQAWATPNPEAVGLPPRFYTLGSFYFIGMPFVFADPGVVLEEAGESTFRGKEYRVLRASYVTGVGHSDRDDYLLYIDPKTHRLALIDHSVTETGVERVTWIFDEWQRENGLLVPQTLTFYPGAPADQAPEDGAITTISEVKLGTKALDPSIYNPPKGAVITSGAE